MSAETGSSLSIPRETRSTAYHPRAFPRAVGLPFAHCHVGSQRHLGKRRQGTGSLVTRFSISLSELITSHQITPAGLARERGPPLGGNFRGSAVMSINFVR